VIADQVWPPLTRTRVDVDEHRRVAVHHHDVGIHLHLGHERGVADGSAQVRRWRLAARAGIPGLERRFVSGPLADEDLRSAAIVLLVLPARHFQENVDGPVVVLVEHVRLDAVDTQTLRLLETDGRYYFELRMPR